MNIYDSICASVSCGSDELQALLAANKHLVMCDIPPCSSRREIMLTAMQKALTFAMTYAAGKVDISESNAESQSEGRSYSEDHSRDRSWGESTAYSCSYSYSDSAAQTFSASATESRDFSEDGSISDTETYTFNYDRDQTIGGAYSTSYNRAGDRSFANGASYAANIDVVDVESWTTKDSCPEQYGNCPLNTTPGDLPDLGTIDLGAPEWPGIGGVAGWLVDVVAWVIDLATGGPSGLAWEHVTGNAPGDILSDPAWAFYHHQCPDQAGETFNDGICPAAPEDTLCNGHKRVAVTHERDVGVAVFNWAWKYKIEQEWTQQHTITHNCDESFSRSHSDTSSVGDSSTASQGASQGESETNQQAVGHQDIVSNGDETSQSHAASASSGSSAEWGYARSISHSEDESQSQSATVSWSRSQSESWSQSQSQSESYSVSVTWSDIMNSLQSLWATVEAELANMDENRVKMRGRPVRSLLSCKKATPRDIYDYTNRPMVTCQPKKIVLQGAPIC